VSGTASRAGGTSPDPANVCGQRTSRDQLNRSRIEEAFRDREKDNL
jgi:hypothetical protein